MTNDPILHLLGLARKAGRLELGEEPVGAVCRARQAKLVLLAADAAPNTRRRCAHFGEAGGVLWLELPFSKAELGAQFSRGSCAMLALTDAGFSATLVEKLAARDPARYAPAAQQLREKADRVLQRQKEQRRHEKNLREGKRKPWAPPPAGKGAAARPPKPPDGDAPRTHSHAKKNLKPKPPAKGASAPHAKDGPARPGRSPSSGPGARRLSGKIPKKRGGFHI